MLVCLASAGSVAQIFDTFKLSVLKQEKGRKLAPASIIFPLFIQNNSAEARKAGTHSVSYRNLLAIRAVGGPHSNRTSAIVIPGLMSLPLQRREPYASAVPQ